MNLDCLNWYFLCKFLNWWGYGKVVGLLCELGIWNKMDLCVCGFFLYNFINLKECILFRNIYYVLDFIVLFVS